MRNLIGLLVCGLLVLTSTLAHAATLESPAPGANVSGLGYIGGWKCHHGEVTVRIDGGGPIRMATRMPRADTQSACQGATDNGFIAQFNWAFLADGSHTAVAYDNGVEFARSTFTVATFGEEFVMGAQGECMIEDLPSPDETAHFRWNESTQHLELVGDGTEIQPPPDGESYTHNLDSIAGFDTHGTPLPMISTVAGRTALDLNGDGCYDSGVVFNVPEAVFPITEGLEISLEFYMNTNRYYAHWLSVAMMATDYRPDSAPVGADGCSDPRDRAPAGDSYRLFSLGPQTTTDRMRVGPAFVGGSPDADSVAYTQAGWNHLRMQILSDRRIEVWLNQRRLGIVEHSRAQAGYGREGYVWIMGRSASDPVLVDNLRVVGGGEPDLRALASYGRFHVIAHELSEAQDHDAECRAQLGSGFRLADWNDIVSYYQGGGSLAAFTAGLKMVPAGEQPGPGELGNGYRISRDGNAIWSGRRHYFVARHDHNKPSHFLDHANLDNYHVSLGSWYGTGGYALCYD
ncbi:MAG: hypothetical protein J4F42_11005 [Desulfurellaceae bacterium]|nr:hypothetical protein [Desulfurellaceae bacterium]